MAKWIAYRVNGKGQLVKLGHCEGNHQPAALRDAQEKFPSAIDWKQTQGGITVRKSKT